MSCLRCSWMAPCYTLVPPQANFLSTLQRGEVTPHSTGWEAGEQVWRRVENLSRKSPECLPMAIDIRPRFCYAELHHCDMSCREKPGEGEAWTFTRLSIRSLSCFATVAVSPMALCNANSASMMPTSKTSRQNSLSPNASQWMSTDRSWYGQEGQRRPRRSRLSQPPHRIPLSAQRRDMETVVGYACMGRC